MPRRPATGSELQLMFFHSMSSSLTTGNLPAACAQFLHRKRWPSTRDNSFGIPIYPHTPILVRGGLFEASLRFTCVTTCCFACPPVGADRTHTQPSRTFTSGLSSAWSPAPPPDITTVPTEQSAPAGLAPARSPTCFTALSLRPIRPPLLTEGSVC